MTRYEQHIGRESGPDDMINEREWYVSRILTEQQIKDRKKLKKENVQLRLFDK